MTRRPVPASFVIVDGGWRHVPVGPSDKVCRH